VVMNPVPRKTDQATIDLIEQFFKNGGAVKKLPAFQHSETIEYTKGFYGKKPKSTKTTPVETTELE